MNMKNLEYLKDQLKYTGFGEGHESQLKEKIGKELPEFQMNYRTEFGKDVVTATLDFTKSKNSDMYFFNQYQVEFKPEGLDKLLSQTYRMAKVNNTTLKEAYNLLSGRSVFKEMTKMEKVGEGEDVKFVPTDQKYHSWTKLNFKESDKFGNFKKMPFHENYGFQHKELLASMPLVIDNDKTLPKAIQSLEKGNVTSVKIVENGETVERNLVADPEFKRIDVYDKDMNKLDSVLQKTLEKTLSEQPDLNTGVVEKTISEQPVVTNLGAKPAVKAEKAKTVRKSKKSTQKV